MRKFRKEVEAGVVRNGRRKVAQDGPGGAPGVVGRGAAVERCTPPAVLPAVLPVPPEQRPGVVVYARQCGVAEGQQPLRERARITGDEGECCPSAIWWYVQKL